MNTDGYSIVNGPSRDRLFDSFRYNYDSEKITVCFSVEVGYTTPPDDPRGASIWKEVIATVSGLEYEDGSGEKFNVSGHCVGIVEHGSTFKAFYDSKRRKGHLTFNR